ncbi:MAG: calcium/sodium antiporter [Rikenellaceae bacterium]
MEPHLIAYIYIIVGISLILGGANYLTDGASALAKRFYISEFVIGLTIVALGTSLPEMVVSFVSAVKGNPDIAIGNVVGSNSFNTLVIVGLCALLSPMNLTKKSVKRDIPMGIGVSAILFVATFGGVINRLEGLIMFALYIFMIYYSVRSSRQKPLAEESATEHEQPTHKHSLTTSILLTGGGLVALVVGGQIFIDSAVLIANHHAIPQNIIAITLVAGATSLPELAASLISLLKGKSDIALGNIIGSNIANILLVLGASATFTPLTMTTISMLDIAFILSSSIMLWIAAIIPPQNKISRPTAILFIIIYTIYLYTSIK